MSADDVKVTVTRSAGLDRAVVIFIDTRFEPNASDGGPGLRVILNDDPVYEGLPAQFDGDSLGAVGASTLTVSLREIDYEHPHDTGYYEEN